eukprot:scpid79370/ scgid13172/ 
MCVAVHSRLAQGPGADISAQAASAATVRPLSEATRLLTGRGWLSKGRRMIPRTSSFKLSKHAASDRVEKKASRHATRPNQQNTCMYMYYSVEVVSAQLHYIDV